jgi:hypothetical protein
MRRPVAPAVVVLSLALAGIPPLSAQSQTQSQTQNQASPPAVPRVYDASREVVLHGAITETTTKPPKGLPLGLHLMLASSQGNVDVHMGPYFSQTATEKGLIPGAIVEVTGVTMHLAAGDIFLARTVVVNGQTITVRNANGLPVRPLPATRTVRGSQPAGGQ